MRKKNHAPSVRITITVPTQVRDYLGQLVSIGLHGSTVADVAAQLIFEQLRVDLKHRRVKLIEQSAPREE